MTALAFAVVGASCEPHAAVPTIIFRLRIDAADSTPIHALSLQCQIRIEPQRRHYTKEEEVRLYELFGDTPQWGSSLRPFLWTHVSCMVAGFEGSTEVDLPIPCSYDFEVAGAKYLHSLSDGEIPLLLLFSGTVFGHGETGFSVSRVAWDSEASFRMPVAVWRRTMDQYFPNSGWLRLDRGTIDSLRQVKAERALPTFDQVVEALIKESEG